MAAQHELALVIDTPQSVRLARIGQRRSLSFVATPLTPFDQAVAIQYGMNGALGWRLDHGIFPDQVIADLGGTPAGIFALELQDCALDLERQLIGVAVRSAAAVLQSVKVTILVSVEYFIASRP